MAAAVAHLAIQRKRMEKLASHRRFALVSIVLKTGSTSVGELLMTLRIRLVAVCCSRASVTCAWASVSAILLLQLGEQAGTFSMAMTAWSAKVFRSSSSASENRPASRRVTMMAPMASPSSSIGTVSTLRNPSRRPCCRANSIAEGSSMSGISRTDRVSIAIPGAVSMSASGVPGPRGGQRFRRAAIVRRVVQHRAVGAEHGGSGRVRRVARRSGRWCRTPAARRCECC